MASGGAQLQERLAALRSSYAGQLPNKVRAIEKTWQQLATGAWDLQELKQLHRLCHSLTGSGATFGFDAISSAARTLELQFKALLESGSEPSAEDVLRLSADMQHLWAALAGGATPTPAAAPGKAAGMGAEAYAAPNRLIYLVEDDAHVREELSLQLRQFGYEIEVFDTPATLAATIGRTRPAAIVMDIIFPQGRLAGTETVTAIRQSSEITPPVVFISSRADIDARLHAVRAGGEGYFTKPVDVSALVDRLDQLTARDTPEPYRILVVDDEPALADHYALTLEQAGMHAECVNDPMHIMQALAGLRPELILMDVYMPGCSGRELAAVIRQDPEFVSVPIVFLSTESDRERQLEAIALGADDFLAKPIQPELLVAAVHSRVRRARVLRSLMLHDGLTGLLNHTATEEYLGAELTRSRRQASPLAFAMIDIDHFKTINDTHGHAVGDRVIKSLARLLRQRLRKSDVIGRYGGEEFAVVLTDTDEGTAVQLMNGVREAFGHLCFQSESGDFSVTLSCGIAAASNHPTAAALSDAADRALYDSKRAGRNRVTLAQSPAA